VTGEGVTGDNGSSRLDVRDDAIQPPR